MHNGLPQLISSETDAERFAATHMGGMGFEEVEICPPGEERATHIIALGGSALIQHRPQPANVCDVQQARGSGGINDYALVYALGGFTLGAQQFAEDYEVALFKYSAEGTIEAHSSSAVRLLEHGWLSIGPAIETMAREALKSAIKDYAQAVIDSATEMSTYIQTAVNELEEGNEYVDEDMVTDAQTTSRNLKLVADLIVQMSERQTWDPSILIRDAQRAETIVYKVAERWDIDFSDVELDASVKRLLDK